MECRMRTRVREMVEGLAREYQKELAAAGTFRDLEELTAEIGDEFGRQLCENELRDRARRAANVEHAECPAEFRIPGLEFRLEFRARIPGTPYTTMIIPPRSASMAPWLAQ